MAITPAMHHTRYVSVRETLLQAWRTRRVWWFTSTARTKARFARTTLGVFGSDCPIYFQSQCWLLFTEPSLKSKIFLFM